MARLGDATITVPVARLDFSEGPVGRPKRPLKADRIRLRSISEGHDPEAKAQAILMWLRKWPKFLLAIRPEMLREQRRQAQRRQGARRETAEQRAERLRIRRERERSR